MARACRSLFGTTILLLAVFPAILGTSLAQETLPLVRVGMSLDGTKEVAETKIQQFHHELQALMEHDFEFVFDDVYYDVI